MNRQELIELTASNAELTKAQAERAIDGFIDALAQGVKRDGDVVLRGFGTFSLKERAARKGRNPKTGEEVSIEPRKVVHFKQGKLLKDFVG